MKSTFKVLFYVKKQSVKNGKAPVDRKSVV